MDYKSIYKDVVDNEDYQVTDIEKKYNIDLLGVGNSRMVFDLKNGNVIKVSKTKHLCIDNKQEVRNWEEKGIQEYLADLREYDDGYRWIIMEKCEKASKGEANNFFNELEEKGINSLEQHYKNVGVKDNKMVLIDYGHKILVEN